MNTKIKQLREQIKSLVEGYEVFTTLSPAEAVEQYGYYLDPIEKKTINGAVHYRVIFPDMNSKGGWCQKYGIPVENHYSFQPIIQKTAVPLQSSIMKKIVYTQGKETPIINQSEIRQEEFTDVRQLSDDPIVNFAKRSVGKGVKAVKRGFDPDYQSGSRHYHADKYVTKNTLKKAKHDYLSDVHGLKGKNYDLRNQMYGYRTFGESVDIDSDSVQTYNNARTTADYIKGVALPKRKWDYLDTRDSLKMKLRAAKKDFKNQYNLDNY
jgi:hypothetical protein